MEKQLNEIVSRLGRIEGKQDAAVTNQIRIDEHLDRQDDRIVNLEKGHSRLLGYGAGVAGLFGFLISVFKFI